MKVKLTLIETNGGGLRTPDVIGETISLPSIGLSFEMTADSLTEGNFIREITTSPVQHIERASDDSTALRFKTLNSTYELQRLSEGGEDDFS